MRSSGSPYRSFPARPITSYGPRRADPPPTTYQSRTLPGFEISGSALKPSLPASALARHRPITARIASTMSSPVRGRRDQNVHPMRRVATARRAKSARPPLGRPAQERGLDPGLESHPQWITITKYGGGGAEDILEQSPRQNANSSAKETSSIRNTETTSTATSFLPEVPVVIVKRLGLLPARSQEGINGRSPPECHVHVDAPDKTGCSSAESLAASSGGDNSGEASDRNNKSMPADMTGALSPRLAARRDVSPRGASPIPHPRQWVSAPERAVSPTMATPGPRLPPDSTDHLSATPSTECARNDVIRHSMATAASITDDPSPEWPADAEEAEGNIFLTTVQDTGCGQTSDIKAKESSTIPDDHSSMEIESKLMNSPRHNEHFTTHFNEINRESTISSALNSDREPVNETIRRQRPQSSHPSRTPLPAIPPQHSVRCNELPEPLRDPANRPGSPVDVVRLMADAEDVDQTGKRHRSVSFADHVSSKEPPAKPEVELHPVRTRPITARVKSARPAVSRALTTAGIRQDHNENFATTPSKSGSDNQEETSVEESGPNANIVDLPTGDTSNGRTDTRHSAANTRPKTSRSRGGSTRATIQERRHESLNDPVIPKNDSAQLDDERGCHVTVLANHVDIDGERDIDDEDSIPDDTNSEASDLDTNKVCTDHYRYHTRPKTGRGGRVASTLPTGDQDDNAMLSDEWAEGTDKRDHETGVDTDTLTANPQPTQAEHIQNKNPIRATRPKTSYRHVSLVGEPLADISRQSRPSTGPARVKGKPPVGNHSDKRIPAVSDEFTSFHTERSRPLTGVASRSNVMTSHRPKSCVIRPKSRSMNHGLPPGAMTVVLSVANILLGEEDDKLSRAKDFQNRILTFYTTILREESFYKRKIAKLPEFQDIRVQAITLGSLKLHCLVQTLDALDCLEKAYRDSALAKVLTDALLTPQVLRDIGVQKMELMADIDQKQLLRCKHDLASMNRKLSLSIRGRPPAITRTRTEFSLRGKRRNSINSSELSAESSDKEFMTRVECIGHLNEGAHEFKDGVTALHIRHTNIATRSNDFMMTLKLVKPVQLKEFKYLADVIALHSYLENSPSVGKSLPTSLVNDFLAIVNLSHQYLKDITARVRTLEHHMLKYIGKDSIVDFYRKILDFRELLDPSFMFSALESDCPIELSIMDNRLFSKLMCYLPSLLENLEELIYKLEVIQGELNMISPPPQVDTNGRD